MDHNWRITRVVQEFVEENDIKANIEIDEDDDSSFTIFSTSSDAGSLRTIISIDEDSGYFMMYVILAEQTIPEDKIQETLRYINHANLHTKIGAFHIFKHQGDNYLRHYQGLLGDDMEIDAHLIYNMLVEAVDALQMRAPQLEQILHEGKRTEDIFVDIKN